MKRLIVLAALAGLALPVLAATPDQEKNTPQQEKMKMCNADASKKALKGDDRKKFMSDCLSDKGAAAPAAQEKQMTPQQAKMKSCNADASAKSLKGEERKKFMSQCLKG
jgi:hypothetical protein